MTDYTSAQRLPTRPKAEWLSAQRVLPDDLQLIRDRLRHQSVVITAWKWAKRTWNKLSRID